MSDQDNVVNSSSLEKWTLRLYIAGQTPRSVRALENLKQLCQDYLADKNYEIQVIDLLTNPQLAERDQIVVIPTLVRLLPKPIKKVFGDLSNTEKALSTLQT